MPEKEKEKEREQKMEKPAEEKLEPENNVSAPEQVPADEPRIIRVPGDLIARIFYVCENEGCAQTWQAQTRSLPLHCPFCGGPIAIAALLVQSDYTAEQRAEMQARAMAAQQAAMAAQQAAQQAAQGHAGQPKPVMRPIQRTPPR